MTIWVEINCGERGYQREMWIRKWLEIIEYFFDTKPVYERGNGPVVYWAFRDEELGKTMTDIWSLENEDYRTSYQSKIQTFFWVDSNFYKQNRRAILEFAERYNCKMPSTEYGWIEMPNHKVEMLFRLQWAGKCYG